ncbi:DNA polymerase Y family protein [Paracoccus sp. R12_1]|uniref:Y-family DNA polymerase n=1 Tax=unclassified Paracoccus (in: a-proteobacteria) TaxID=2688777 RepID=UPI001AD97D54|nr:MULTISPECIES: DNA polymerase Y family protein [unclassified Paracoccus (in: a-proteobacteria)]MBO9454629.1 DNA polymerase Y family protein [Paracoccus sp. R12_2]MBO9486183.1 DNA polymerase Y family protein [Paracoccus sp. R12_1]
MARVISVFLPMWPLDRLRRQDDSPSDRPLVLAGRIGNRRVLTAVDAGAAGLGLAAGMPVSKAQALVPDLRIEAGNPQADLASLERLAFWVLQRIAPIVAVDPPDGIVIDSTGADHLHGGEEALLEALTGRLALSAVTARTAVADTWGAAHALARFGGDLAQMPPEALRLPSATVAGLRDMGFATIGDLMTAPRAPLTRRFGPELIRRIDQMFGAASEPIDALRPAGLIETRRAFAEPIGAAETIARYIGKLVTALCAELETHGLGVRRLDLICHRVDRELQTVRIGLAVPQRDPQRLTRLLCDKIPTIAPGFGIEIMTLTATITEPLAVRQVSTLAPEAPDLSGLIDTLANRVGPRAIYRIAPVASDVPERSIRRIPALAEPTTEGWPDHWPRPTRLFARPEPIQTMALLPDQPPVWIAWKGIRRRIKRADGPERIFGEWWTREAERIAVRDYFRIEDEAGERLWIFRAGDGKDAATGSHRWFIHGVFG